MPSFHSVHINLLSFLDSCMNYIINEIKIPKKVQTWG